MAGGRVYTGTRALELGLVDEIGGLGEAIAFAAKEAMVDANSAKLVPEPKSPIEGLFAKPAKPGEGEIVKMGARRSPAAEAVVATLGEAKLSTLPKPLRETMTRALERIEAVSEAKIQLIGPDVELRMK